MQCSDDAKTQPYELRRTLSNIKYTFSPQRQGNVKVDTVTVADGNEAVVMDAVDAAERDNQWCVVRHLHLASPALLRELTGVVHRMVSSRRGEW